MKIRSSSPIFDPADDHEPASRRCYLASGDPRNAEDIVEELLPKCSKKARNLAERCHILLGKCQIARGERVAAHGSLSLAYNIARERENFHHARVAQVALTGLSR